MKGVPIKFRAKLRSTGEYVYSTQVRQYEKDLTQGYIDSDEVYNICQLVGYDAAGEEVYEGDKVTDKYGHNLTVRIEGIVENTNSREFFRASWGCNFDFKLKKQGD